MTLALYFGVILVAEWMPSIRATGPYFLYVLSLPLVLLGLLGIGIWAGIGWWSSTDAPRANAHRARLIVSVAGLMFLLTALGLSRTIQGALPTGSELLAFNRSVWLDPVSSQFVDGDITPRQEMLADVVNNVLPGQSCEEIQGRLGPSLETPYFQGTGRDLIYVLGPERDSFMRVDFEWLLIWCSPSGRFERYEILTD